jgi:cell division protease FtsH
MYRCVLDLAPRLEKNLESRTEAKHELEDDMDNIENQRPRKRVSIFWWMVILALFIWNAVSFWPHAQPAVELPYSEFVHQVRSNNVTSVTIQGSDIRGDFKEAIQWAEPTQAGVPTQSQKTPEAAAGSTPIASPQPTQIPVEYQHFNTVFPETVGDPNLLTLLEAHAVSVDVQSPSSPWFTILLTDGLPILLFIVLIVWMGRRAAQNQNGIFNFGRSKARRHIKALSDVTFQDVAGADEAKGELEDVVDFLRYPGKYHDLGARIPRGVLLVGPPGTGKTLMARAVAGEADVPFFNISASEFVEMFVGVGASRVRDLFEEAKSASPSIVFIDELDAVGRRRGAGLGAVNDEREQTLNQLLVEMDGFDERQEVIIMAATNRPDVLDPALLRPGRFDRQVVVPLPDRRGREGILRIHTRHLSLESDVDLPLLARTTTGLNGADLANLCNEATLIAARHNHVKVGMADFEEALDKILLGGIRPLLLDPHDRCVVAYHEAGHAIAAWLTPGADPVHKVTIIPRGQALGVTEQIPGSDHYNYSRSYLNTRLAVMLSGRSAEEIAMGDITTGAENDLVEATILARRMVTRWSMGSLDSVAFRVDEQQPFLGYEMAQGREYSEDTAAKIDHDVQELLAERHRYTRDLLSSHRASLDHLVDVLLKEETIDKEKLEEILGPRPHDVYTFESQVA